MARDGNVVHARAPDAGPARHAAQNRLCVRYVIAGEAGPMLNALTR
jgi:hypothetical protein